MQTQETKETTVVLPSWDDIKVMSTSELTILKMKVDKYSEVITRYLRSKMYN